MDAKEKAPRRKGKLFRIDEVIYKPLPWGGFLTREPAALGCLTLILYCSAGTRLGLQNHEIAKSHNHEIHANIRPVTRSLLPFSDCRNSFPNLRREFFLNATGADSSGILNHHGSRSGKGDDQPHQTGKGKAGESNELEQVSVVGIVMPDGSKRDEEQNRRNTCDDDQPNIDAAMQALARAAMRALHEMLLIVAAHFRRYAGDVVPPAGENVANYLIHAL